MTSWPGGAAERWSSDGPTSLPDVSPAFVIACLFADHLKIFLYSNCFTF